MKHLFAALLMLTLAAFCPARAFALERKEQLPAEMLLKICGASMTRPLRGDIRFGYLPKRVVENKANAFHLGNAPADDMDDPGLRYRGGVWSAGRRTT